MSIKEALIAFIEAVLAKENDSEKARVVMELKDFSPLTEAGFALTFGYSYGPKNKVILWSSDRTTFPQVLTVEQGVDTFLKHYGLE